MKKLALQCLFIVLIGSSLFAQAKPQAKPQTTTIKGTLGLSNGRISVVSGDTTYYVKGLRRFVGFIDGLKEGAQVSLEGYASPVRKEGQKDRLFHPVKLTLNGKNYEVGSPDGNRGFDKPRRQQGQNGKFRPTPRWGMPNGGKMMPGRNDKRPSHRGKSL